MIVCPNCGNEAQDTAVFCDQCGTRLKEPESIATAVAEVAEPARAEGVRCAACGYPNVPGELFCENCGVALDALEPEPAVPAETAEAAPAAETVETPTEAAPAEPAEAAAPAAPETTVEVPAAVGATCPACGAAVGVDDEFCDNCGAALKEVAAPPAEAEVAPTPAPAGAGPHLVVADTGAEIPLPAGAEILVGREDPISGIFPDIDLTPHGGEDGGVSRKHLRIRAQDGGYTVEDLDSTNFTFVNHQRLTPGSPQPVKDGDELRLGRVRLLFKSQ